MARAKELTVEDKLKYLYELQQVDSKIDNLRTLAGELPQEVKDMADEVEGLKTRLANIENDIKECETQISDHRVRTENANASTSRYKEQQNSVRNNREFDNLNKEIRTVDLNQKRSELDQILAETKAETEALVLKANELEKKLDERLLTGFKRIRKSARNGLAVVKIERDSCGGCHAKIPAQLQLDIRTRKKIIVCEFCGRILVDPEM